MCVRVGVGGGGGCVLGVVTPHLIWVTEITYFMTVVYVCMWECVCGEEAVCAGLSSSIMDEIGGSVRNRATGRRSRGKNNF